MHPPREGPPDLTGVLTPRSPPRNCANRASMAFPKHCVLKDTVPFHSSAPIAPAATQPGSRFTVWPSTPPNAAAPPPPRRASSPQRHGPSPAAPEWLGVAKAGDRKASAPARRARRSSATPCAELVSAGRLRGAPPGHRPPRRCSPARSAAANRQSPATDNPRPRARHSRARRSPRAARPDVPSWRSTTPHSPRGSRAAAASGSAIRR
jgi:hypothetical protein